MDDVYPIPVRIVDSAVELYSVLFAFQSDKNRQHLLDYFVSNVDKGNVAITVGVGLIPNLTIGSTGLAFGSLSESGAAAEVTPDDGELGFGGGNASIINVLMTILGLLKYLSGRNKSLGSPAIINTIRDFIISLIDIPNHKLSVGAGNRTVGTGANVGTGAVGGGTGSGGGGGTVAGVNGMQSTAGRKVDRRMFRIIS